MKNRIEEITKHYYTGNHLSSTQLVTDASGVAVQQVEYAPFGEVVNEYNSDWSSGQVPDFKFNAKELDEENGMYYFEARYQRPLVFISRDVLFEKYPMFSPYAYCANNPLRYIDPTGMVFDSASQVVVNNFKAETNTRINTITDKMSNITDHNSDKYKNLETQLTEYQNALTEIGELENDIDNIYQFNFDRLPSGLSALSDNANGELQYKGVNKSGQKIIEIVIRGYQSLTFSIQAHELKHAHQYCEGELGFYIDANGSVVNTNDSKPLEREAHFRQAIYRGDKLSTGTNASTYKLQGYTNYPDNVVFPSSQYLKRERLQFIRNCQ
jgi:RHS repeat-associated protein